MFALLFLVTSFTAVSHAREYNCTVDQDACTGSAVQTIVVAGERMCCPNNATFTLNITDCTCVEPEPVIKEEQCLEGPTRCLRAPLATTDSKGQVRCCPPGYLLNSVTNSYVNGVLMDVCTCTHASDGGASFRSLVSTFLGLEGNGSASGGGGQGSGGGVGSGGGGGFGGVGFRRGGRTGGVIRGGMMMAMVPGVGSFSVVHGGRMVNSTAMPSLWSRTYDRLSLLGRKMRRWGHGFRQRMRGVGHRLSSTINGAIHSIFDRVRGRLFRRRFFRARVVPPAVPSASGRSRAGARGAGKKGPPSVVYRDGTVETGRRRVEP